MSEVFHEVGVLQIIIPSRRKTRPLWYALSRIGCKSPCSPSHSHYSWRSARVFRLMNQIVPDDSCSPDLHGGGLLTPDSLLAAAALC